jgi:hypothetical protein
MLLLFLILAGIVLAQPSPPAQGIQIGAPSFGADIRFPLTVTQCEPVFTFYSISTSSLLVYLVTPDLNSYVLTIGPIPVGVGYFEWLCKIPAGYGFWAFGGYSSYYIVVQPGPLSSCLHNITTTYQYAQYNTTAFESYTTRTPMITRVAAFSAT